MRDTITEEDMLIDTTKTELEKDLNSTKRQNEILQERMELMEIQMAKFEKIATQIESVVC